MPLIPHKRESDINSNEYKDLSKEITMLHQEGLIKATGYGRFNPIDIIGFHGITLWHKPADRYTHQIGDAKLLKNVIAKYKNLKNSKIIFNFRENDILNGGQGAPLTPIYHKALMKHLKIVDPRLIVNIGGITNATYLNRGNIFSTDIGPGNCLIDQWIKKMKRTGVTGRTLDHMIAEGVNFLIIWMIIYWWFIYSRFIYIYIYIYIYMYIYTFFAL